MKIVQTILIIFLIPASLFSQRIDSLINLLPDLQGKSRVEILLQIGEEYLTSNPNQSFSAADEAIKLSQELSDKLLFGKSTQLKAKALFRQNQFERSKKLLLISLKIFDQLKDTASIASVYDNLGDVYDRAGNKDSALICFDTVRILAGIIGDKKLESLSYSSTGLIYWRMGQNQTSLEYHFKALELRREINFDHGIAMTLNTIG